MLCVSEPCSYLTYSLVFGGIGNEPWKRGRSLLCAELGLHGRRNVLKFIMLACKCTWYQTSLISADSSFCVSRSDQCILMIRHSLPTNMKALDSCSTSAHHLLVAISCSLSHPYIKCSLDQRVTCISSSENETQREREREIHSLDCLNAGLGASRGRTIGIQHGLDRGYLLQSEISNALYFRRSQFRREGRKRGIFKKPQRHLYVQGCVFLVIFIN
ncbi:hypothetical protein F5X97DRAFT_262686 [Nemania serpens]|nr:hypothetical protein F5X97DRAFT_262686 [Nemania serpens]